MSIPAIPDGRKTREDYLDACSDEQYAGLCKVEMDVDVICPLIAGHDGDHSRSDGKPGADDGHTEKAAYARAIAYVNRFIEQTVLGERCADRYDHRRHRRNLRRLRGRIGEGSQKGRRGAPSSKN